MQQFRIRLENQTRKGLEIMLEQSEKLGDLKTAKRIMAIFAVNEEYTYSEISLILKVTEEAIRLWVKKFLTEGLNGLKTKIIPGRKSKLTKSQKKELSQIIEEGPHKAGFHAGCWRSPMVQTIIFERFGIFYSVHYISQLLKNMGFSYQKAKFISDHIDPEERTKWLEIKWPEIVKLAEKKNAQIMFGDESSFPQWGSLSYTWARKGKQPVVKTSGIRKSYKVFGLIDYFTGRFYCKGHEGRLNSETYAAFLKDVLSKTRKHIILIQDGAPYHKSKLMKDFFEKHQRRLTVYRLPSYSPDYNPIEMLWKKIKEKEIHLHYFPTFEDLKNKVNDALLRFKNLNKEVLSLFGLYKKELTKGNSIDTTPKSFS